jgi:heavy metal sensor kinase
LVKFNSIRFKIGALYVIILGLILTLFSITLYSSARYLLYRNLDGELREKAQELITVINIYAESALDHDAFVQASRKVIHFRTGVSAPQSTVTLEKRLFEVVDRYNLGDDFICLIDQYGSVIAASRPKQRPVENLEPLLKSWNERFMQARREVIQYQTIAGFRSILVPVRTRFGTNFSLLISTPMVSIDRLLDEWSLFVGLATLIFTVVSIFLGNIFASQILNPVKSVTDIANKITHEDLEARVEQSVADDEMVALVGAFNQMITRLEKSFKAISEFSSHVAHELKTPLAVMRGEAEVALRKERGAEDYKKVLMNNLREMLRMIRVIDDMLLLTTLDYDPQSLRFQRMELGEFMRELADSARILAEPKAIRVSLAAPEIPLWVSADATHLRRLFLNLIENAVKFSRSNEKVELRVRVREPFVEIDVTDSGPGIPEGDVPRIFDKFFHRERTVNPEAPGHGLGLSIALSIARAHQGDIRVQSRVHQGSTFTVVLPLLRP